eukprot:COSAG01_NODE_320_length_18904_cov_45.662537_9_plen_75_part_00
MTPRCSFRSVNKKLLSKNSAGTLAYYHVSKNSSGRSFAGGGRGRGYGATEARALPPLCAGWCSPLRLRVLCVLQ